MLCGVIFLVRLQWKFDNDHFLGVKLSVVVRETYSAFLSESCFVFCFSLQATHVRQWLI